MLKRFLVVSTWAIVVLASGQALADDSEIFGGSVIDVPANVLIIFDTSGSMSEKVPADDYDPSYHYADDYGGSGWGGGTEPPAGTTNDTRVYHSIGAGGGWSDDSDWEPFADDITSLDCAEAKASLSTYGYWLGEITSSSPYSCGEGEGTFQNLATGNYINFLSSPDTTEAPKIDVAKNAINNLINSLDDGEVRLGLMRFNSSNRGGEVVVPVDDLESDNVQRNAITTAMNSFTANGATPLGETMAEAGLYFAGLSSWANTDVADMPSGSSGLTYSSPIEWRCQQNVIILMTDGEATWDDGSGNGANIFTRSDYIHGNDINDYDGDGNTANDNWLDDVAKFLNDEDLIVAPATDSANVSYDSTEGAYARQYIKTYTIGFGVNSGSDAALMQLLFETASHGEGKAFTASSSKQLEAVFLYVFSEIFSNNMSFVAPVVPVSKMNRRYSGSSVYLGLFSPQDSGLWKGNLKKFGIDDDGKLFQKDGTAATSANGTILSDATSFWQSSTSDGAVVDKGGAGAVMLTQTSPAKAFYTYKPGNTNTTLTHSSNSFTKANTLITAADLSVATDDLKNDLVDYLRAEGSKWNPETGTRAREWMFGDILHSKPVVKHVYNTNETMIITGANDGFLHCFIDNDLGDNDPTPPDTPDYTNDTIRQQWSFVPWDLMDDLYKLHPDIKINNNHEYFVDGQLLLYPVDTGGTGADDTLHLIFGLRRGGDKYYTLDLGTIDSSGNYTGGYATPEWKWSVGPTVTNLAETLAQSWSSPRSCKLKTATGSTQAILLTGGYDTAQDSDTPNSDPPTNTPAAGDTKGRAIFAIDASTGAIIGGTSPILRFSHADGTTSMTHSIIDSVIFDRDDTRLDDTIYAGDLGGNIFAGSANETNGQWSLSKLFDARDGSTANMWLKFFYAPDVVLENYGDFVFAGTGDRAHPNEDVTVNRFYAVKNRWPSPAVTFHETDLDDVTIYDYDTVSHSYTNGWFIKLNERDGEKVVSSPLVFDEKVYFTTYVPEASVSITDKCGKSSVGKGRVYALDYKTGRAVYNWDTTSTDGDGNQVIDRKDRSRETGDGIPSSPTIVVTPTGPKVLIGGGGSGGPGLQTIDTGQGNNINKYYWYQQ